MRQPTDNQKARFRSICLPHLRSRPRSSGALILLALLALPGGLALAAGATPRGPAKPGARRSSAVTISYADLIDATAVTRTGRRLADAVRDPRTPLDYLQPFLDGYSSLLPYVVEMEQGPDPVPRRDILERWPPGSPQPAWVALFRGGKYRAVADGEGRVRLFLPGDEGAAAWRKNYPVVRHCLAALAAAGTPLSVEIFAYRNDYRRQELSLDLRPVLVAGSSFPPDRTPFDVRSLDTFFRSGAQLEGARLEPLGGLVLYGKPGHHDTFAGVPVALADLAVAYRAVFHAGDNDAFISLDPNEDPALASVNFGGYLEDTRLGATALAADRIFKTIASGLDPITVRDRRGEIRKRFPMFLTNSERRFLDDSTAPATVWLKGRCWFYPESISVDTDPVEGFAVITRPQFTAAAERLGKSFENTAAEKGVVLPPWIQENIRSINANYPLYSAAFPEFGDLEPLARLMAVAAWLRRADTSWLDLDALLAVELPAVATPRTLEQVISAEYIAVPMAERITEANVKTRSGAICLTQILRRNVGEIFGDPSILADFLCAAREPGLQHCSRSEAEDAALFAANREKPLRSLLGSGIDSVTLLDFLASRIKYPLSSEAIAAEAEQVAYQERLERLLAERAAANTALVAAGDASQGSPALQEQQRIEAEIEGMMKNFQNGSRPSTVWRTKFSFQANGGISLRPAEFSIRASGTSPAMYLFKKQVKGAANATEQDKGSGSLVRSCPSDDNASVDAPGEKVPGAAAVKAAPPPAPVAGPARVPKLGSKRVSLPAGAAGASGVQGELGTDGRIIFHKTPP